MTQGTGQRICALDEIPDGGALAREVAIGAESESLVLLRRGEVVRAFHNVCPHAGRALDWAPGRFLIDSGLLVCAAHGATFSIPDGRCVAGPCRGQSLREVEVIIEVSDVRLVPAST